MKCGDGKKCAPNGGGGGEEYSFDLTAMTYATPRDRGTITELNTDDSGFMTFVLGNGRRYVHKNPGGGDPTSSYLYLSRQDMRELRCSARYAAPDPTGEVGARRALAGHYYLSGVMETGSELLLRADGRFVWFMSYGAMDLEAQGKWRIDAGAVVLEADTGNGAEPAFRELRLRIDDGTLLLEGADKGRYTRQP